MRDCPYVGLDFFREDDAHLFYGRDEDRRRVVANLAAARLTLLYAESGVGKSSLLHAGVAAPLRKRSKAYIPVIFNRWGDNPTGRLITALDDAVHDFGATEDGIARAPSLEAALLRAEEVTGAMPLVILDQFEDHLLYSTKANRFDGELAACINKRDLPANFLISIRQDAYSEIGTRFETQIPNLYGNYLQLDFLDDAAAREAATKPLRAYGRRLGADHYRIDDDLLDELFTQLRGLRVEIEEGAKGHERVETTFLQLVLDRLWHYEQAHDSNRMRLETLKDLGGAKQIVFGHLDDAMRELRPRERDAWAAGFRVLVTSTGRKIAMTTCEVASGAEVPRERLEPGLGHLEEQRILRSVPALTPDGDVRHELFHDALATAVLDWRRQWTERRERGRGLRRGFLICLGALVVVAVAALIFSQCGAANRNAARARALGLVSAADNQLTTRPDVSLELAFQAFDDNASAETVNAVLNAFARVSTTAATAVLKGHERSVRTVAFSPDGRRIASGGDDGTIRLWNAATRQESGLIRIGSSVVRALAFAPGSRALAWSSEDRTELVDIRGRRLRSLPAPAVSLAWSPDGRTLALGGWGEVRLFDAFTGRELVPWEPGHVNWIAAVAFSPDGRQLASAGADGTFAVRDLTSGRTTIKERNRQAFRALAWSRDGTMIALAEDDYADSTWLYDVKRRRPVGDRLTGSGTTQSLAFSPDGRSLAVAGYQRIGLYDTRTRMPLGAPLTGHTSWVYQVAFAPDGRTLASAGADRTLRLWNLTAATQRGALEGSKGAVQSVAYAPDGTLLASGGADRAVRFWDVRRREPAGAPLTGAKAPITSVAFSPPADRLAAADTSGAIRLYDVASRRADRTLRQDGEATAVAFDRTGQTLASAGSDGRVHLWDVDSGRELRPALEGHRGAVTAVAFSPDGRTLASVGEDQTLRRWSVKDHRALAPPLPGHFAAVRALAYSPDGQLIATGGDDRTVLLWNARTGQLAGTPLVGHSNSVTSVDFSRDGQTLASGSADRTIRMWDVRSRRPIGPPAIGHTGAVTSVAFSPDGRQIASGSVDRTIEFSRAIFWSGVDDLKHRVCALLGSGLSESEWRTYVWDPSINYRRTC